MPRPVANPYDVGDPLRATLNTRDTEILNYVDEGFGLFNVRAYGATGNGTTNDTTTIQAAIDAAIAAGGGIVFFPKGTYLANGLTCAGDNVSFLGTGWGSILRQVATAADNTAMLLVSGTGITAASNRRNVRIDDLQFYGRSETETFTEYVHMVVFSGVSHARVTGCQFKAWRGDAIYMGSGFPSAVERHNVDIQVERNLFDGVSNTQRNGVSIIDGTDIYIERNAFRNVSTSFSPGPIDMEPNSSYSAVRNIHVTENSFENCSGNVGNVTFDMNPTQASLTTKSQGIYIRDNTFRGVGGTSSCVFMRHHQTPAVTSVPNNIVIEGNHLLDAPADSIYVEGVRGIKIRDNYIANSPQTAIAVGWAFAVMDIEMTDNHFHKSGTSGGTTIAIMSVTRGKIARNVFDTIGDGAGTGRLMSFSYNSSVPSVSSDIDMVDNRVIGTGATVISAKDASHTLTASSNRAQGNDTSLTVNSAHFDKQATLTYSRTGEPASAAALRTELATAKVLVDNTTA